MDTVTVVKNRILVLRGEREIISNKLTAISALPLTNIKNIGTRSYAHVFPSTQMKVLLKLNSIMTIFIGFVEK